MVTFTNDHVLDISKVNHFYNRYASWKVPNKDSDWAKMLSNSDAVISVWDGGKLVGMMRALSDAVRWATILDVLVHPDYRNQGLGTALLNRLLAEEIMHVRTIYIGTENAKMFYAKNGFETANDKGEWMILIQRENDC